MRDRKLYDLLRRLSADERALFAEFLRSPLHAHRPKLAEMVELMERLLFAAPEQPCSSEDFYAAFYPGKPFDSNNLNRLISVITSEFKEFLALRFFQRDRTARTACATREMSRRRWDDILPKEIALTRKVLQEELPDDEHNYYQLYCLEYENARHYMENAGKKGSTIYNAIFDAIDSYFLLTKTKLRCVSREYDQRYNANHSIRWEAVLETEDARFLGAKCLTTALFNRANESLYSEPSIENHEEYVSLLQKSLPYYDKEGFPEPGGKVNKVDAESLFLFGHVISTRVGHRFRDFQKHAYMQNTEMSIEKGILFEEGFLSSLAFQNYVRNAVALDRIEAGWRFLLYNKNFLHPKEQRTAVPLCEAVLLLAEEKADEALTTLLRLKAELTIKDFFQKHLETRLMLCIAWYQLGDLDGLLYESNAMRTYISRTKSLNKNSFPSYFLFLKAVTAIEKAERQVNPIRGKRLSKLISDFSQGQKFAGVKMLQREILKRHSQEIKTWHQE